MRIKPSGVKSYFYQFRSTETGSKRRITIAQYGELTLDEARNLAKDHARDVRHKINMAMRVKIAAPRTLPKI